MLTLQILLSILRHQHLAMKDHHITEKVKDVDILDEPSHIEQCTSSEDAGKDENTCTYNPPHVSPPPHSDKDSISPVYSSREVLHIVQKIPQLSIPLDDPSVSIDKEGINASSKSYEGNVVRMR